VTIDSTRSGKEGRKVIERAPFALQPGETIKLRVFVDKSVIEIYSNDWQAICRRVYPGGRDSLRVCLVAQGGTAVFKIVQVWEMAPAHPY
jgi:beta-fructofuranosidase